MLQRGSDISFLGPWPLFRDVGRGFRPEPGPAPFRRAEYAAKKATIAADCPLATTQDSSMARYSSPLFRDMVAFFLTAVYRLREPKVWTRRPFPPPSLKECTHVSRIITDMDSPAKRMKFGYVLLDGCGDRPVPSLNFTTPLEAANTPYLDSMARRSKMGTVITVGKGIAPESDIAVFNMLGYSFASGYPGRGVVESIGAGLKFRDGELALRANFATSKDGLISDRRAGRDLTEKEAKGLERVINGVKLEGADFEFRSTVGYRAVVVIRASGRLSAEVSNTDPAYVRTRGFGAAVEVKGVEKVQKCVPLEDDSAANKSAKLVNEFLAKASKALEDADVNAARRKEGKKPANLLLLRDAGDHLPVVTSFREKYGMKGVALVEMPAEIGIARLLGMKEVMLEDHRDLAKKAKLFNQKLSEDTVVYAHIKGPDEFGHDGDASGKKKNIETIDQVFFSQVSEQRKDATLAVSCDHATPSTLKMHSSDPVPLLITTKQRDVDCCRFTEADAAAGSLGVLRGSDVLSTVLSIS